MARRVAAIDPSIQVEAVVTEADARNLPGLLAGADLAIDGTDNFRTRHLLNEVCHQQNVPWIYGACVGAYGLSLPITPGHGPCLRCLQDQLPGPGETPTCDTVGVIAPIVHQVASEQVAEALRFLVGLPLRHHLWTTDLWKGERRQIDVSRWRDPDCAVCGPHPTWPALTATIDADLTMCGRDAVQVRLGRAIDTVALSTRLPVGAVAAANDHLVRWADGPHLLTAFRDGRVVVHGVADGAAARVVVDRWLG